MSFIMRGFYEAFIQRPVNSVVHRRSPFVRPIFPVIAAFASIVANNVFAALVVLASVMAFAAIASSMRREVVILRSAFIFSILLFLIVFLADGWEAALVSMLKFINVMASISLISAVILLEEMEAMGRFVRMPRDMTFVFAAAVKFIPVILIDLQEIVHSQMSHGVEFTFKNPVKQVRALVPLLMPLTVMTIKRSEELADAMTVRGYGMSDRPTLLYRFRLTRIDWAFAVLSSVAGLAILYVILNPAIFTGI
jgi:energy-coupling factor transport system permease protein